MGREEVIGEASPDLWKAVFSGNLEAVKRQLKLLKEKDGDVDALGTYWHKGFENEKHEVTALHMLLKGSTRADMRIATLLLAAGASLLVVDVCGHTPLQSASEAGYPCVVEAMLNRPVAPASPNAMGTCGTTPLHLAGFAGNADCVNLLLKADPSVTLVHDKYGRTPAEQAHAMNHFVIEESMRAAEAAYMLAAQAAYMGDA